MKTDETGNPLLHAIRFARDSQGNLQITVDYKGESAWPEGWSLQKDENGLPVLKWTVSNAKQLLLPQSGSQEALLFSGMAVTLCTVGLLMRTPAFKQREKKKTERGEQTDESQRRWPQALALSAVLGLSGMTAMYTPLLVHPVLAAQTCTITLHPGNTGSLAGRKFELYRLMDAQEAEDGSSIHYTINPLCKPALVRTICDRKGIALQDMTDQQILDEVETYRTIVGQPEGVQSDFRQFVESLRPNLMQYANPEKRVTITQADVSAADGSYVFKNLKPGWYLLNEADIPSSAQTHQAASLCVVDTWTKNMDVQLKGSVPQLIKKIEEDDQNVGWNDIGDYQGGQNIPYRIDVAVPSMEEYDTYFMKIHDVMDAGLTLHPDSIRCSFVEGSQIKTIPAGQYRVETGTEGETFAVCFDDVKGLVNSILPKFDAAGNHVYGQTLRIEFEGEFNENAFTSGEGMTAQENDARLEYSSDPRADGQESTTSPHGIPLSAIPMR
ncbi:isopeptide-forming domain-containing fimbrial protein [Allobaculum sp. Allo2]|nr:isopeptide-forming domain-containing fimbrial protein [Allobaculum sp. Allo2]UNT93383.1 isopeptide-forming domain-containing fimbrial protein [Allobaculum sp. Allo2]